ncbi:MAG: hypothetical protein EA369_00265 [Bradymonadales bacterium]|nr:MAG: hypothetical protein EA369_00265 [Bradymonadales bacterium]
MEGDELLVLIVSALVALGGVFSTQTLSLHRLYVERNAGIGLSRLSVLLSLLWVLFVIFFFADESVRGIYVLFYMVMAYAVIKVLGQVSVRILTFSLRVDVYERRNLAAALVVSSFTLATGIIFGCSLWGDADPLSGSEGGWWIPLGFFALGWSVLVGLCFLFIWRDPNPVRTRIRQDRSLGEGFSLSAFILSSSIVIGDAVSGHFLGWSESLLGFGAIVGMLIFHEIVSPRPSLRRHGTAPLRLSEALGYLFLAVLSLIAGWVINNYVLGIFS